MCRCPSPLSNGSVPGGGATPREASELWRGDFRTLTPGVLPDGPITVNGRTFDVVNRTVGETVDIDATEGLRFNWPNVTVGNVNADPPTVSDVSIELADLIVPFDPALRYIVEVLCTRFDPAAGNGQRAIVNLWSAANVPLTGAALRNRGPLFFRYSIGTGGENRAATQQGGATVPGTTASALFPTIADTLALIVGPAPPDSFSSLSSGGDFSGVREAVGRFQPGTVATAGDLSPDSARATRLRLAAGNSGAGNAAFVAAFSLIRVLAA